MDAAVDTRLALASPATKAACAARILSTPRWLPLGGFTCATRKGRSGTPRSARTDLAKSARPCAYLEGMAG